MSSGPILTYFFIAGMFWLSGVDVLIAGIAGLIFSLASIPIFYWIEEG